MYEINLNSTPVIGKSYDFLILGETLKKVEKLINFKKCDVDVNDSKQCWEYEKNLIGHKKICYEYLSYKNDAIRLNFFDGILTDIYLGKGWLGNFLGLSIGDKINEQMEFANLIFDDQEDQFLFEIDSEILRGISIDTDAKCSFEYNKNQFIERFRIYKACDS